MSGPGIVVVGGVYAEAVRSPRRFELYGSGGRAAAALSSLKTPTTLVTALGSLAREYFTPMASAFGFQMRTIATDDTIEFIYDHPLGEPRIRPRDYQVASIEAIPKPA